ncbi:MAG: hypothetical protein HXY40_18860 [Chloroflexi bacterium]|nr:hypothetical protein [Chloroflexota bacterium]
MNLEKPRLIYQASVERKRFFRRFTLTFLAALACAAAWFALEEASARAVVSAALSGIGQLVALIALVLFGLRALVNLWTWLRRKDEMLRFYDQGFTWIRGQESYKASWNKLVTFREGAHTLRLGRLALLQWGAHTLKMHDGPLLRFTAAHGDPRAFAKAVRPFVADVTGTRIARTLRSEKPVRLHPHLVVWPGGLEIDKLKVPWTELDVRLKGSRIVVYRLGKNDKFKAIHSYPLAQVDNAAGFLELAASTVKNYQPDRFNIKTQSRLPKIDDIRYAPGIYKGTPMRSQSEISFASELDARRIRWQYEPGPLGRSKFVVDFYLPDYGAWVDIRRTEPNAKEQVILAQVADALWLERNRERLFVFMPEGALLVNPQGNRAMGRDDFWIRLAKP